MLVPWSTLKDECPMTIQIIEKKTGFKFSNIYGTLLKDEKTPIRHEDVERFFDDHGWIMVVQPTNYPIWNGWISDTTDTVLYYDPISFHHVNSRNYAKSFITGIAVKMFEKQLEEMLAINEKTLVLDINALQDYAKQKDIYDIKFEDLTLDAMGLVASSECAVISLFGGNAMVLKNTSELPFIGMVITI